mmetsp:Transcript_42402/g.116990  ORF Transcript_42402/g.116990 Transcript_42402/m.116990 type:complete len:292 (+) Transcript_42402:117-992(+)
MSATVLLSGLPGEMCYEVAKAALRCGFSLSEKHLTGPKTVVPLWVRAHQEVHIAEAGKRAEVQVVCADDAAQQRCVLEEARARYGENLVVVDFTHATSVNKNAEMYAAVGIDFVMGTTGGDREELMRVTEASGVYAVIAPNMSKQAIAMEAALAHIADTFPGAFSGFELEVAESAPEGKPSRNVAGQPIVAAFRSMGAAFSDDNVKEIRDRVGSTKMGVPEESLQSHVFQSYALRTADGSATLRLDSQFCGLGYLADSAIDAVTFLLAMKAAKESKKVYAMTDVMAFHPSH